MFKVVYKDSSKVGVLDTSDGVIEYYSYDDIDDFIRGYEADIEGCVYYKCDSSFKDILYIYTDEDILFRSEHYQLVLDRDKNCVYVICSKYKYLGYRNRVISLIYTKQGYLMFKRKFKQSFDLTDNTGIMLEACIKAKEISNTYCHSLFIDFDSCLLEIYYNNFEEIDWLNYVIIKK